ncbi:hypothetical protein EPO17_03505 [Patescibacteria group bacterium]|nr:MAG: hypothetical protein EPO17_03505 [Patescibacteria group bacterium]
MKIFQQGDYKKLFWAFIFLCAFVAGGVWFLNRNTQATPSTEEPTVCTMEAKLCPDGSYVGRSGPRCEFAECPSSNTSSSALKTYTDSVQGVTFKYPETLSTSYVSPVKWPPEVALTKTAFSCSPGGSLTSPSGKVEERKINGNTYCLTTSTEGAAGSTYTSYTYTWDKNGFVPALTFTIRTIQCANYDEPKKAQCEKERATFNTDTIADKIAQTVVISANASTAPSVLSKKVLTNGTHVFQTFNNCGPAALSMIFSYFGVQINQEILGEEIRPYRNKTGSNDNKSTSPAMLGASAKKHSFLNYYRAGGSIERLEELVANGIPVLVRTHLHLNDTIAHYRIVKGYDKDAKQIIQDDSYEGKNLKFSYAKFNELWRPFNNGYQIIIPKDKQAIVEKILGEDIDEELAWKKAVTTAEKAIAANRNDTIAHLNLSTASFYLGDYAKSVKEFEIIESKIPLQMLWYQYEPIESYFHLGNYTRVFEISDKILNGGNRAFVELYNLRAKSYQALGDNAKAQAEYAKAEMYSKKPVAN